VLIFVVALITGPLGRAAYPKTSSTRSFANVGIIADFWPFAWNTVSSTVDSMVGAAFSGTLYQLGRGFILD